MLDTLADHPLSIELVAPHLKKLTPEAIIADFAKLIAGFRRGAGVERNESLLASLAFSTSRLSDAAQAALPWLGMFSGGVFEIVLLDVSELDPQQWQSRARNAKPPRSFESNMTFCWEIVLTRASTRRWRMRRSGPLHVIREKRGKRLVGVYFAVTRTVDRVLRGSNPRTGLELMSREEANVRAAGTLGRK